MTDAETFAFADVIRGLDTAFPKRLDDHQRGERIRVYTKAFRRFSLSQVQAGADAWVQRGKFFPKPAEWIDAMPRQRVVVDIPLLTEDEAREYHRAEALKYEDRPCSCPPCRACGVQEKPLRFIPEERQVKDGDRIVRAGHWAHGQELADWYRSRADFYDGFLQIFPKHGMR